MDAIQSARPVAIAERYYHTMYPGDELFWNLRDRHMFGTLLAVLDFHGKRPRAWSGCIIPV